MEQPETEKKKAVSCSLKIAGNLRFETKTEIRELFEKLGIHYAPRTIFTPECAMFKETERSDYLEYRKGLKISEEIFEKFSQQLHEGFKAPFYIKWISGEVGYGIFASEDIPANTLISEYTGLVMLRDNVKNRTWSWKYPSKGQFIDRYPSAVSLDGGLYGNEMRFLNHGDNRNTSPVCVHNGSTWVNCYFARKPIAKDQELLVNYGKRYWKNRVKIDL